MKQLTLEDYARMEEAWKYQDFITKEMLKFGISINAYQSVFYQLKYGESASGIEIKNDRRMSESNNVYIEFKQITLRGSEKESGIQQKDDSWLYIIGDYERFFIFAKSQLVSLLHKVEKKPKEWWNEHKIAIRTHKNDDGVITSTGLVIPIEYIEKRNLAIKTVVIKEEN